MTRILVAGMGNVLRHDDGFGVEVVRQLATAHAFPDGVKVVDVGIGGIHLVHELMEGYDALVVIDAVERNSAPGTVHPLEVMTPDLATWTDEERGDFLADTHYTTPSKALILANALGVLPPRVFLLGCEPADTDTLGLGLSGPVAKATSEVLRHLESIVAQLTACDGLRRSRDVAD